MGSVARQVPPLGPPHHLGSEGPDSGAVWGLGRTADLGGAYSLPWVQIGHWDS